MIMNWLALVPPITVILLALILQRIHFSLGVGVVTAALVASKGSLSHTWSLTIEALFATISNSENIYLYSFLTVIGLLVAIFGTTGCAASCARAITNRIHTKKGALYSSMLVSSLLFIDDYLSILTTGYIMRSLTDRFAIARQKLAYLVHSLSGPIVILVPISSWVATIIAYIDQAGVDIDPHQKLRILADPFFVYLKSIPFIFYSFLTIASAWFIIYRDISFGSMKQYEETAIENNNDGPIIENKYGIWELLLPLITLIGGTLVGLPAAGGYYLFGGNNGFIDSIKYNDHPFLVMLIAAVLAVLVSLVMSFVHKSLKASQLPFVIKQGFDLMFPAIGMVYLATTFSSLLANHVGTGQYLATIMLGSVPNALIPLMFFIVSLISTIATGSAWGSFAIMIPIGIPMLTSLSGLPLPTDPSNLPLLYPVLGAIFSGSACGDHISPMSETTIMTGASTGTRPFEHAATQFPYAIPAIICSAIAYLIVGFFATSSPIISLGLSLGIGLTLCLSMLASMNKK